MHGTFSYNTKRNMKTMKLFLAAALLVCSQALSAQTTVTQATERYLVANGQIGSMSNSMKPLLVNLTGLMQITVPDGYTTESLVEKYIGERFIHDISASVAPYIIDQNVTAEEINVLSDMLETSEGKTATINSQRLNSDENLADMMAIVERDITTLMSGGKPEKTPVRASAGRKSLFMAYYNSCGIDKMIPSLIKAQLAGKASDETIAKIESYFNENMSNLLLNASEGIMTDNDLRFYQRLCAKPQYVKMIDGTANAISDPMKLGMSIVTKYKTWAEGL